VAKKRLSCFSPLYPDGISGAAENSVRPGPVIGHDSSSRWQLEERLSLAKPCSAINERDQVLQPQQRQARQKNKGSIANRKKLDVELTGRRFLDESSE
jgi:hypothetical protein